MAGKQITDLDTADNLEEGDLMLIRKSGLGKDQSLSKARLIESIGNPAVNGYIATSETENKITLRASNTALVPAYCDGMKISFISPINTNALVQVKIGALGYIDFYKYSSKETVQLIKDEYVEAVYIDGMFKQTNNLNTHLVWSNEYVAKAEIALDQKTTIYHLSSAIGVKKPNYYVGMSLLFTVPADSAGVVFFNVDGLGAKPVGESRGSIIAKEIYKDQALIAIYDGEKFVKQKFSAIHYKPMNVEPIVEKEIKEIDIKKIEEIPKIKDPGIAQAMWNENDLDDPANATSPQSVDSKGKPIFAKVITVGGSNCMFKSLNDAIKALVNDYGDDGGGQKFAIEIDAKNYVEYGQYYSHWYLQGRLDTADLRWISIFSKNNEMLNLSKCQILLHCGYSPIFNCKMSFKRRLINSLNPTTEDLSEGMISQRAFEANLNFKLITFGRNTVIEHYSHSGSTIFSLRSAGFEAKYGITIRTNTIIIHYYFEDLLMNKGRIEISNVRLNDGDKHLEGVKNTPIISLGQDSICKIYNTTISVPDGYKNVIYGDKATVYLENVTSTDRKGKMIGVKVANNSTVTMKDCNFASKTDGTLNDGCDIVIDWGANSVIHLQNTTGNRNQAPGKKTDKGIIHQH